MQPKHRQFEKRKQDHIKLAMMPDNQAVEHNAIEQISLLHEAMPDLNFADICIKAKRFGETVPTPFIISSMTAGHAGALNINQNLMAAANQSGWAMGVGSQRRELMDDAASTEWKILRKKFPDVTLFSNIGLAQILEFSSAQIEKLAVNLKARALIVHCNPLQEVIQPEGTPRFKGGWQALEKLISHMDIPVIIKETGCGFSIATLKRLNDIGIAAVDVSGLGGTHWGRIEGHRAEQFELLRKTADTFKNWGISTVQSIRNAVSICPDYEIWGSGGVRHGLDAAKLFALGATTAGFAKPALEAALVGTEQVFQWMQSIEYELKVAMFCTGSSQLQDLKEKICR